MDFAIFIDLFTTSLLMMIAAINPIGVASVFAILSKGKNKKQRIGMANRSILTSAIVMLLFALVGSTVLTSLGISFEAFKIAGGLLLLITGIQLAREDVKNNDMLEDDDEANDVAVFPIAIPLTAGPAAITSIVLKMEEAKAHVMYGFGVVMSMLLVLFTVYIFFLFSDVILKALGKYAIGIISRIFGIILCSLAFEFILRGLDESGLFSGHVTL